MKTDCVLIVMSMVKRCLGRYIGEKLHFVPKIALRFLLIKTVDKIKRRKIYRNYLNWSLLKCLLSQ